MVEDLKKSFINAIYERLGHNYTLAQENPGELVDILRIVYSEE